MQKLLLIIFLICSLNLESSAQNTKYGIPEIEYFNRRQYGGGTQNWDITQSKSDLLYFANNDGVIEFDGVTWQRHQEMGKFVVRSVKTIGDRIYAGSFNEVGYFQYDSLCHLSYTSLGKDPLLHNKGDFWNIYDWNGIVVFHSDKAICLMKDDQVFAVIPAVSRFVSAYLVNGLLLVHDETEGLMEVRGKQIYKIRGGEQFAGQMIGSMMSLSDSQIVIGTMNDGLYLWDMEGISEWKVPASMLLERANVFCGVNYKDNLLVFGTIQSGLVICNKQGEVLYVLDKDKGLMNNTVLSVFIDREGNIWGGLDNGLVRVAFNSSVSFLQGYYNIGTGYVMEQYKGENYFGTNQALYSIAEENFKSPLLDRNDFKKIKGTEGQVWSLFQDESNLLCGHNKGVLEIRGADSRLITPAEVDGVWLFKRVKNHPNLLLAGTYHGLIVLEKKAGKWQFKKELTGFEESSRFLEWDEQGYLWMSHGYRGLFRLQFSGDYNEVVQVDTFEVNQFPNSPETVIVSRIGKRVVFASQQGIFTFSEANQGFERYRELDRFYAVGSYPFMVQEDQYKNLWCFHIGRVEVLRYQEDGTYKQIDFPFMPLKNKLVNGFESVYVRDKENVFFGVEDGFAHYAADDRKDFKMPFKVHIRSFKGQNDSVAYSINQNKESEQYRIPEYAFRNNAFEIHYAATYFDDQEIKYSTWLVPFDKEPTDWSVFSTRQFTKLSEGNYEFKVFAKNQYGVEAAPVSFKFIVLPPWYRSNYAKVAYGIILIVLAMAVIYLFNRRIEIYRQREKQKQQERYRAKEDRLKKEALIAEKEMIRMRNEKLRSEMVHKEKELANSTMNIIQKNEFLTAIKDNLKKLKRLDDKTELERKVNALIRKIDKDIDSEKQWEVFETHLEQVHEAFLKRLQEKHPDLSLRERKLCAYIRMGMASKEIAALMNITARAVENNRYRLRQKLNLEQGDNLAAYISKL